ncbi:DUF1206 domain-containing protein [Leptolyngbya iicbica]|uniref:DUF1206 domain-containing protein n=2 Tax=Cyanophyceae TaxID=3028117 RepID=A0A4Q7E8L7_9CYAN|nr:DUF1206 domain-containing protein [Leptolyngbya sp. LK]RZM78724.1 DUF1206 domain-containing protein [Leptolyngbya sp. LK]
MAKLRANWRRVGRRWVRWGQRTLNRLSQRPWARRWMRWGHGAKGLLYGLIGFLALRSVVYDGESAGGSKAVLLALGDRAIGSLILIFLAIGLSGYAFWRLVQMLVDPENFHQSLAFHHVMQRCGYGFSGLTYLGIGYTAGRLAIGLTVDFEDTVEEIAEALFEVPIGPWALLLSGLAVICVGLAYAYGALSGGFINEFQPRLYATVKRTTVVMGKIGFTARGISFMLIGAYLMKSAYFTNDETAGGLGQVLDRLDDQRFGKVWLSAIAIGFFAYATYMVLSAIYRRFPVPESTAPPVSAQRSQ